MPIPYPWQQADWQRLQQQIEQGKTPHALMLSGQKGIGKWVFADALANFLLCSSPKAGLACEQCRSCQLIEANTHPDKRQFFPEEPDKPIKIDQMRELSTFVTKTAQQGGRKVIILGPAEQLNINAANALLKNLEEPAGNTVLILVSHMPSVVMATIRSRCQLLPLVAPPRVESVAWLQELKVDGADTLIELAAGAPLLARQMADSDYLEGLEHFVVSLGSISGITQGAASNEGLSINTSLPEVPTIALAPEWMELNTPLMIEWWLQIIHTMLSKQYQDVSILATQRQNTSIGAMIDGLIDVGKRLNKQWLFKFNDKLLALKKLLLQGGNPNKQLLIEELLLDWQVIVQRS